jgi:hypothetical protein
MASCRGCSSVRVLARNRAAVSAAPARRARLHRALMTTCSAAPEGGAPSWRSMDPTDRIKSAILGYPSEPNGSLEQQQQEQQPVPVPPVAGATSPPAAPPAPGSWQEWNAYFESLDDAVRELDGLSSDIDEAVEAEDYARAAALQAQAEAIDDRDSVGGVLDALEIAIEEERYAEAAKLRDAGSTGVLGWWAGLVEGGDPKGHVVCVVPDFGRYVGQALTGRALGELAGWAATHRGGGGLAAAAESLARDGQDPDAVAPDCGSAVFELFLRGDPQQPSSLEQQAVALHAPASAVGLFDGPPDAESMARALAQELGGSGSDVSVERGRDDSGGEYIRISLKGAGMGGFSPSSTAPGAPLVGGGEHTNDVDEMRAAEDNMANVDPQDPEGSQGVPESIINRMIEVIASAGMGQSAGLAAVAPEAAVDAAPSDRAPSGSAADGGDGANSTARWDAEDDSSDSEGEDEENSLGEGPSTLSEMGLGAVLHRVPASIEWRGRDQFILDVPTTSSSAEANDDVEEGSNREGGGRGGGAAGVRERVAAVLDAGRSAGSRGEVGGKKDAASGKENESFFEVERLVRDAMGQAIAQGIGAVSVGDVVGVTGRITYTRIPLDDPPTDPLTGLYLGAFGPHGPELLRLARETFEGEEWVTATKLTGDPNVPAGEVSFRAKVGRGAKLATTEAYPAEFGVVARYQGKGRVAQEVREKRNMKLVQINVFVFTLQCPPFPRASLFHPPSDVRFSFSVCLPFFFLAGLQSSKMDQRRAAPVLPRQPCHPWRGAGLRL